MHTLHLYLSDVVNRCQADDDAVDAELDDDDATKDVFVALASTSTETRTSETADTDNSSNAILLRLDLIWLTMRSYTIIRTAVNQPRLLRYLCAAMKTRAEPRAPVLNTLRLDIIERPKDDRNGGTQASALEELVENVIWAVSDSNLGGDGASEGMEFN